MPGGRHPPGGARPGDKHQWPSRRRSGLLVHSTSRPMSNEKPPQRVLPPPTPAERGKIRAFVVKLQREGRFDDAIGLVSKVIESEGEPMMDSLVWRARLYAAAGRHVEALADLDVAEGRPGRSEIEAYDLRLRSLRALGREDLADAFAAKTPRPAMPSPSAQGQFQQWLGRAIAGEPAREIEYSVGNAFGPGGAVGLDSLMIHEDERFELENERGTTKRRWLGRLRVGSHAELDSLVASSVFPAMSPHPPVAGSAMRQLTHTGMSMFIPFHDLDDMPGYRALFDALDGIVADAHAGRTSGRVAEVRAHDAAEG